MKKYLLIIIVFLISSGRLLSQQLNSQIPPVDFFKDQKKLLCWNGPLSGSFRSNKHISDVPMMHYFDAKVGAARIICKPNYGFDKWKSIIVKARPNDRERVKKIAVDRTEQKNFTIFAFFMEKKYLVAPTEKPYFPGERNMEFPAPIHVYKLENGKWKHLTRLNVKSGSDYADLKMKYIEK